MGKSAFRPADILIPMSADMRDWSVVACDQFSSQRDYWDRVREATAGKLSSFHMILPEAYLNDIPAQEAAVSANEVMDTYLAADVFEELKDSFVYVERHVTDSIRCGLVGVLDLDAYDYAPGTKSLVRASEETVVERLPARVAIREGARLEIPHVMVIIDDPQKTVIEPLRKKTASMRKVYDFDLMEHGGHIKGWQVTGEDAAEVMSALDVLADRDIQIVIGDGNHSLAAAKECWERVKRDISADELENHPARFALVELNNVYDSGIAFQPIHRIVFNTDPVKLREVFIEKLSCADGRPVVCVQNGQREVINVRGKTFGSMIESIEEVLEDYAEYCEGVIDYIHDDDALISLTGQEGSIGFLLPVMDKSELFETVAGNGLFPKKSFSIGHARDKRYYLECRRIKK